MKHINIPIFIQHMGCPHQCVFCDQHAISGTHSFCFDKVREDIEAAIATKGDRECEIAYFGGSFTGIDRTLMLSLLDLAEEYVQRGLVKGIRMSTRPDYISEEICDILHRYTVSQVELGIQSFSDEVLRAAERGHSAARSLDAVRLLRSEGFSFVGQMMIGLPKSDGESERETARIICDEGAEGARIYPCIVFKNTPLEKMTVRGEYVPLSIEEAAGRSADVYRIILDAHVPVLKIGLHEGENLHSEDTYFAGPNHPAMGEIVKSRIFLDNITKKLCERDARGKCVYINVPPGAASMAAGHKKANKVRIMEKTGAKCVKILENNALWGYNITVDIK